MERYHAYYDSPIGMIEICTTSDCLIGVNFVEAVKQSSPERPAILEDTYKQLDEYFHGQRKDFQLKLHFKGTEFQQKVWSELANISYGEVWSYKELAEKVGSEKAVRAVGNANSKNLISIVLPCHRVIGANGKLTGYAGGLERKKWLLEHEQKQS